MLLHLTRILCDMCVPLHFGPTLLIYAIWVSRIHNYLIHRFISKRTYDITATLFCAWAFSAKREIWKLCREICLYLYIASCMHVVLSLTCDDDAMKNWVLPRLCVCIIACTFTSSSSKSARYTLLQCHFCLFQQIFFSFFFRHRRNTKEKLSLRCHVIVKYIIVYEATIFGYYYYYCCNVVVFFSFIVLGTFFWKKKTNISSNNHNHDQFLDISFGFDWKWKDCLPVKDIHDKFALEQILQKFLKFRI